MSIISRIVEWIRIAVVSTIILDLGRLLAPHFSVTLFAAVLTRNTRVVTFLITLT